MSNIDTNYQLIDFGTEAEGDGDTLRQGAVKINANFTRTLNNVIALNANSGGDGGGSSTTTTTVAAEGNIPANRVVAYGTTGVVLASNTTTRRPLGISTAASSGGAVMIATAGVRNLSGLTAGANYYLTAGGDISMTQSGDNAVLIGVALSTSVLLLLLDVHEPRSKRERLREYAVTMNNYPYQGTLNDDGEWIIVSSALTTPTIARIRYANQLGNPTYTTLADAFTNRFSLTYQTFDDLVLS